MIKHIFRGNSCTIFEALQHGSHRDALAPLGIKNFHKSRPHFEKVFLICETEFVLFLAVLEIRFSRWLRHLTRDVKSDVRILNFI